MFLVPQEKIHFFPKHKQKIVLDKKTLKKMLHIINIEDQNI